MTQKLKSYRLWVCIILSLLLLVSAMSLTACSPNSNTTNPPITQPPVDPEGPTEPKDDFDNLLAKAKGSLPMRPKLTYDQRQFNLGSDIVKLEQERVSEDRKYYVRSYSYLNESVSLFAPVNSISFSGVTAGLENETIKISTSEDEPNSRTRKAIINSAITFARSYGRTGRIASSLVQEFESELAGDVVDDIFAMDEVLPFTLPKYEFTISNASDPIKYSLYSGIIRAKMYLNFVEVYAIEINDDNTKIDLKLAQSLNQWDVDLSQIDDEVSLGIYDSIKQNPDYDGYRVAIIRDPILCEDPKEWRV